MASPELARVPKPVVGKDRLQIDLLVRRPFLGYSAMASISFPSAADATHAATQRQRMSENLEEKRP